MSSRPRHDPVTTPSRPRQMSILSNFDAQTVIPHETTPSPRPRSIPGRGRGRGVDPVTTPSITPKFAANTCPACHHITIAGITELGFILHLEPLQLTDLDEARAIADDVPTFNLFPDRRVRQRWLTHIRHPATVPRHARHVCGTTYGTQTPPAPAQRPHLPDSPPF
jgi:hypothetical protein